MATPLEQLARKVLEHRSDPEALQAVIDEIAHLEEPETGGDAYDEAFRQAAVSGYAATDDDIQIDGDAMVSVAEAGAWVAAWVWVSNEEAGVEDDEGSEA